MYTLDYVGDRLFGRTLRLRVARWVLQFEEASFFQSQAASGVGYSSPGEVAKELDRLVDLGMVLKNEPSAGDRRQYYTRVDDCPLWDVVRAAVAIVNDQSLDGSGT
jgi:hypothetical protein